MCLLYDAGLRKESNMAYRIGQRLGNYQLVRLLGRGGFAEVYLGEQVYLHTQAALKVLRVQLLDEHVQAFLKEAQLIAHLEHPHIVQVHDFAVQDGTPFLVMVYAPHGSVRRLYPAGTVLDARTVLSYVKDVADALQFAHDHGLIHRDVKPENMLVGPDDKLLLSDFGLAIVALSSRQQEALDIVGTVLYMAPEQLRGKPCTASDQYALGVVVYEWLCGVPPFSGTHSEIAVQHAVATPVPLRAKNALISPAVERVVLQALRKDPRQRFPNVAAFATALEQAILADGPEQYSSPVVSVHNLSYPARQQLRPLVGREEEHALLSRLLAETEQCSDRSSPDGLATGWTSPSRVPCAFLLGEAGIGKTRLAEEISQEAYQRGWSVVWSRLYSHECRVPYQLWIEVLRSLLRQGLWRLEEDERRPLFLQPLAALLPELANEPFSQRETSEHEQLRLWETILALLLRISERQPVLLVLDDVHWADSGSCELLGYLVRRLVDCPLLIIGTYREHELPSTHPLATLIGHLQREHVISVMHLAKLTDIQIGELVAEVSEPFNKYIRQQSAGNPFFAEELARISYTEPHAHADQLLHPIKYLLPETITAVLQQRLSKLSSACRQFLAQMAVLGSSFTFATMQLMMNSSSSVLDEEQILEIIDEALQEQVLTEEERRDGSIYYHFWHPLLMSHLYEALSATRRALLHRKAASVLRQIYATREEEGAALIVHHLIHGGADALHILHFAEIAGHHAYALAAYPEAEQYYKIAIKYGRGYEDEDGNHGHIRHLDMQSRRHLAYLLEFLGECTRFQGKYAAARQYYMQALALRTSLEVSGTDLQAEMQLRAMLQCEIGVTWYDVEDGAQALQCYQQSEQMLEAAGICDGHAWADLVFQQSYVYWRNGFYEMARDLAQRAFERFQDALQRETSWKDDMPYPTRLRRTLAGDPVNLGRIYALQAMIANSSGLLNASVEYFHKALAVYEQYHCRREIGLVWCNLGDVYIRKADYSAAEAVSRSALEIAEQIGEIPTASIVTINFGMVAARSGKLVEAKALFQRALVLAEQVNDYAQISLASTYLALIMHDMGDMKQARRYIRQALTVNKQLKVSSCVGPTLIACASLRLARFLPRFATDQEGSFFLPGENEKGMLLRTYKTIEKAFASGELDREARVEGELMLSRIFLLLGRVADAHYQAMQTLDDTLLCGLVGSTAQALRLLGEILTTQTLYEQADHYFQQALQQFQHYGMRLEYARTLRSYGSMLVCAGSERKQYQQGLSYLREARSIYIVCQANYDLQHIEGDLVLLSDSQTPQRA